MCALRNGVAVHPLFWPMSRGLGPEILGADCLVLEEFKVSKGKCTTSLGGRHLCQEAAGSRGAKTLTQPETARKP